MSDYSVIADREIFPRVYEMADQIFPEFGFKPQGKNWVSSNKRKIDGTDGNRIGVVYIYQNSPFYLQDYTRGGIAITTYLQKQGTCSSPLEAIRYLAREVGVQLPERKLSEEDIERINKKERQAELFDTMNDFFITGLLEEKGSDVDAVRKYLNEDRGYSEHLPKTQDDIRANNKMEIGFFPSRGKLKNHLKSRGFDPKEIDTLFTASGIGDTHKIAIPFRTLGRIVCFAFRTCMEDMERKYLYSTGSRGTTLFNFKPPKTGNRDLIVVEGIFDALHPKVCGMDNVVALGNASLTSQHVELIKKYGYESITLWLDKDTTGIDATDRAIEIINKSGTGIKTYVIEIPDKYKNRNGNPIKDPDELIRECGMDACNDVINAARRWYIYQSDKIFGQLAQTWADKERDRLLVALSAIGSKINDPIEGDTYKKHLEINAGKTGVSGEAIKIAIDKVRVEANKERQFESLKKGLDVAQGHIKFGDMDQAVNEIKNIEKQFSTNEKKIDYEELIIPDNEDKIIAALRRKPPGIYSGYSIITNHHTNTLFEIKIPTGALTIVAACTGHGKTMLLINMALNLVDQISSGKSIYVFTYEEAEHALYPKILNTYINERLDPDNRSCIENILRNGDSDQKSKFSLGREKYINEIMKPRKIKINYVTFSANELIRAIKYAYEYGNAGLVIIDYVQLLQVEAGDKKFNTRQEEVKQLFQDLRVCANNTGLPIIGAAQFNREVNGVNDLHSHNIREAADIEQASSLILGLWNKTKKSEGAKIEDFQPEPYIYMRIMKNREGISEIGGDFPFNGNTGKISNYTNNNSAINPLRASKLTPLSDMAYPEANNVS